MVKRFKKGLALVLAAAMVFSTPVALNKTTAKAGTTTAEADIITDTTSEADRMETTGFKTGWSNYYKVSGDFDVVFDVQLDDVVPGANWFTPMLFLTTDANRETTEYQELVVPRLDNFSDNTGGGDNKTKSGAAVTGSNDYATVTGKEDPWADWRTDLKGASIEASVSRSANDFKVVYKITGASGKVYTQNYTFTDELAADLRLSWSGNTTACTIKSFTVRSTEGYSTLEASKQEATLITNGEAADKTLDVKALLTATDYTYDAEADEYTGEANADAVIKYVSSAQDVATVSDAGVVSLADPAKKGTAVIMASYMSDNTEDAKVLATAKITVKVTTEAKTLVVSATEGATESDQDVTLTVNKTTNAETETVTYTKDATAGTKTLYAVVGPEEAEGYTIVWASADAKVEVKAAEDGKSAEVTFSSAYLSGTPDDQDSVNVTVTLKNQAGSTVQEKTIAVKTAINETDYVKPVRIDIDGDTTINANDGVQLSATVIGAGDKEPTYKEVTWELADDDSKEIAQISESGLVTLKAGAKDGDKIKVVAKSNDPDADVTSDPYELTVKLVADVQTLTGTAWWTGMQAGKDYTLSGDGTVTVYVAKKSEGYGAFSFEMYSELDNNGQKANKIETDEPGNEYITSGSDGNMWYAEAAKGDAITGIPSVNDSQLEQGHVYSVTLTRSGQDFTVRYYDETAKEEVWLHEAKNTNVGTDIVYHVMAQEGTYEVIRTDKALVTEVVSGAKAVRGGNGDKIDVTFDVVDGADVTVTVNDRDEIDSEDITIEDGKGSFSYPVTKAGNYNFEIEGQKEEDSEHYYVGNTTTASLRLYSIGGSLYEGAKDLLTAELAAKKADDGYDITWGAAEGVTSTCTVADATGNVVATLNAPGKVENGKLTDNTEYTATLLLVKDTKAQETSTKFTYVAKKEGEKTSKWAQITSQPVLYWEFNSANENGLKLTGKANVTDGVLNLATVADQKHETYAQIPDLTSYDFSKGMTVTMTVKVLGYNEAGNGWEKFFVFGNGDIGDTALADGDVAFGFTRDFNAAMDSQKSFSKKTGYYGNGTVVRNGVEDAAGLTAAPMASPLVYNWYADTAKQNRFDTITLTVAEDGTMATYFNKDQIQTYKTDEFKDILEAMKKATNNYLGASYYSDYDLPCAFDDFAIYNTALSAEDVAKLAGEIQTDTKAANVPATTTTTQTASSQKKSLLIKSVSAKKGAKKVTGTLNVSGAKVTVKVGKKAAKSATVKGKNFTFKTSALKIGTKVVVKATKSGYSNASKTVTVKGTIKISGVKAKKGSKKITGKVSVKKATVKVKVGKKAYKKATVKGKKFTFNTSALKKGTKVKIKVTKKNYTTKIKTVKVK